MTSRTVDNLNKVSEEKSVPFTIKLVDGSYIQWDKKDGAFRVVYYARKAVKEFDLRNAIALAMRKKPYGAQIDTIMQYIEQREEYADAISS